MIAKSITFFGNKCILVCDGNCEKAWGISNRPKIQLSDDIDDYEYLSDGELETAPENPGTYEGECGKPTSPTEKLNKWCARECERSEMPRDGEWFQLPDFSKKIKNIGNQNA